MEKNQSFFDKMDYFTRNPFSWVVFCSCLFIMVGCSSGGNDDDDNAVAMTPFSLNFAAVDGSRVVGCDDVLTGLGPDQQNSVGISDLRFYISNLQFYDAANNKIALSLDSDEFQYHSDAGSVSLIDLTSNTSGACVGSAIAFSEGTARTNTDISGMRADIPVARVTFDVGVPQAVMKDVIANNTAEGAPSPLAEMYWSWASGYRHFVMNFTVEDGESTSGEGYLHVGSRDCGGDGALALTDRESCGYVNTPTVFLDDFDPTTQIVTVDISSLLNDLVFVAPIVDTEPPFEILGEGPGVACHSSPSDTQPDCGPIFQNLGLDETSGLADAATNAVFSYQ